MAKVEPKWSASQCNTATQTCIVVMGVMPFLFLVPHLSSGGMFFFYPFMFFGKRFRERMGQRAVVKMFLLGGIAFVSSCVILSLRVG